MVISTTNSYFGDCHTNTNAINKVTMYGRRLGRPQALIAEGGPVGFSDGGNRRDWFPGGGGRPKRSPNGDIILINALILALAARNDKSPMLSP